MEGNRPINSRRLLANKMADFCGSLPLPSMGDTDIFSFNSQLIAKIVLSLFWASSAHTTSSFLKVKCVQ